MRIQLPSQRYPHHVAGSKVIGTIEGYGVQKGHFSNYSCQYDFKRSNRGAYIFATLRMSLSFGRFVLMRPRDGLDAAIMSIKSIQLQFDTGWISITSIDAWWSQSSFPSLDLCVGRPIQIMQSVRTGVGRHTRIL
jgi:hypothetical protein